MRILLDTNVLLRLAGRGHPHHAIAEQSIVTLQAAGHQLSLVPQVLFEYWVPGDNWVVATRPVADNGLAMASSVVATAIEDWLNVFTLCRDERRIFEIWRTLVSQHDVKGKNAHDARLVAAMQRHGLTHILTFNDSDFRRFSGISILVPSAVVNQAT